MYTVNWSYCQTETNAYQFQPSHIYQALATLNVKHLHYVHIPFRRSIRLRKTHFHVYNSEILHVRPMAYSEVQPHNLNPLRLFYCLGYAHFVRCMSGNSIYKFVEVWERLEEETWVGGVKRKRAHVKLLSIWFMWNFIIIFQMSVLQ